MSQPPAEAKTLMDNIVERLISKFHPKRIYLFGSRARGDARPDSDYDFLVEVEKKPSGDMVTRQGMTWLNDFPDTEIQVHLRCTGELEFRKDDPGTIDWDVVREGRLLFALDGLPSIDPGAQTMLVRERRNAPPASFDGWVAHAERDLLLASHLSSDFAEWKESICFHAQQAAENFLKTLIIAQHAHPARTHELIRLLHQLRTLGLDLHDLDDDAVFLSPFAVDVQYPDEKGGIASNEAGRMAHPVEVTESEARRALAAAQRIEAAVRPHLPFTHGKLV